MRRGFVLLAVMIGLAMSLVAAMALLQLAQVETTGAFHSVERAQSHALARSGIEVLSSELGAQREDMLAGRAPRLDEQYVIYEAGSTLGVVRLLSLGATGELIESETGKLDVNEVSAEQLVATGLVEEELANRIVQFRDKALGRPIQSLSELVQIPGMTNELLFGSQERFQQQFASLNRTSTDESIDREHVSPLVARSMSGAGGAALADVLTVYSIEADVRMDGTPRIDLSTPPEGADRAAAEPDGEEPAEEVPPAGESSEPTVELNPDLPQLLRPLVRTGTTFTKPSAIASVLRQNNIPAEEWPEYFETCTTHPGELRHGRIDINRAPVQALLGVPGFTIEHAEAIASAQETLTDAERATVCWPLLAGIIEPEPFSEAIDHITNRSWCYRVRMVAGEVSGDEPDAPLESAVVFEIVFDLATIEPRVAYLRDITLMPTMLVLAERHDAASTDPLDARMQTYVLDDELMAWDEAYSKDETAAEDGEEASDATEVSGSSSLPSQPSLPDFPTLPALGEDDATTGAPPDGATPAATQAGSNASGGSQPAAPVRRLGRWRAGSSP